MKIGITGGIGSGKSYVCNLLREQGIEVFDCDSAAKQLMRTSADIQEKLTDLIGPGRYHSTALQSATKASPREQNHSARV